MKIVLALLALCATYTATADDGYELTITNAYYDCGYWYVETDLPMEANDIIKVNYYQMNWRTCWLEEYGKVGENRIKLRLPRDFEDVIQIAIVRNGYYWVESNRYDGGHIAAYFQMVNFGKCDIRIGSYWALPLSAKRVNITLCGTVFMIR